MKIQRTFYVITGITGVVYCSFLLYYSTKCVRYKNWGHNTFLMGEISKEMYTPRKLKVVLERRSFHKPPECRNFTTRLYQSRSFLSTALVSYPGSGNTWLRHLIEMATGIFTGSVYLDENLLSRGFIGEKEDWKSGTTIVQKSHMKYSEKFPFIRGILLIRDPVTATRSFVQYMESGHTGFSSPTTFLRKEWPLYMIHTAYDWLSLAKSWLESPAEMLVIHYEDLRDDPIFEIKKICEFLKVDCSRTESSCFNKNIEGSFHRKKTFWKTKMLLPTKVKEKIDNGIKFLNDIMIKYNKTLLPITKYERYRSLNYQFVDLPNKTQSL